VATFTLIDSLTTCASSVELAENGDVEITLTHQGVTATIALKPDSARTLADAIERVLPLKATRR
jgi:hypothetical protein